ncbi:Imm45 family immunity protein [Asaia platycodi]|uniref:Imm45 family immunity protein n=1 Tax=Asaia platycodi TaxID=610243 RepID=UPI000472B4A6
MRSFVKLIELENKYLTRGSVFRLPAKYPYESIVDFMVCENLASVSRFSLMVTTGYKAGIIFQNFPLESLYDNCSISVGWIVENWDEWIYPECTVENVFVSDGYVPNMQ